MHLRSAFTGLTLAVMLAVGGGIVATGLPDSAHAASTTASGKAMPRAQMSGGSKVFINNTSLSLQVTIFVRKGADPSGGDAGQQSFMLASGSSQPVSYGDSSDVYLNGLAFVANNGQQQTQESRRVVARGGPWDNLLNTNNTITFTTPDIDSVSGSNT